MVNSPKIFKILKSSKTNQVYFDHNATTPLLEDLVHLIPVWLQEWGNPSSIHWASRGPKSYIRESREKIANSINCHPLEIIFTSGGSESNNLALHGVFEAQLLKGIKPNQMHFVTSTIEHPSVIKSLDNLEALGAKVSRVSVNRNGVFDIEQLNILLSLTEYNNKNHNPIEIKFKMVSVQYANNETGFILPIQKIAELTKNYGALFHSDIVQGYGKIPVDLEKLNVNLASISAHKFYGLKGTGALFVQKGVSINPIIFGGGQERRRRGGTENVLGIQAFGYNSQYLNQVEEQGARVLELRQILENRVLSEISQSELTGGKAQRLPNTSSFVIAGVDGETLLMRLDLDGFAVSTGAACSSGSPEPSPVLLAIGLSRKEAQSSLRVSLGWETTIDEVHRFVDQLKIIVQQLRKVQI